MNKREGSPIKKLAEVSTARSVGSSDNGKSCCCEFNQASIRHKRVYISSNVSCSG